MSLSLVFLPSVAVAYARGVGPYPETAPVAWEELAGWLRQNGIRERCKPVYGILHDRPEHVPMQERRYDAAVPIAGVPMERCSGKIARGRLAGGAHVHVQRVGCYSGLPATYQRMLKMFAGDHSMMIDSSRPRLLIYRNDPDTTPATKLITDFYVPTMPAPTA